jgi:hypothetical protein
LLLTIRDASIELPFNGDGRFQLRISNPFFPIVLLGHAARSSIQA